MSSKLQEASGLSATSKKLWREASMMLTFGLVGLGATMTHIMVVATLLATTTLPVLAANAIAFLSAFGISLAGNYIWTFNVPGTLRRVACRFLLVSLGAFLINTLALASMLRTGRLSPLFAAMIAAIIVPLVTFTVSRLWVFKSRVDGQ